MWSAILAFVLLEPAAVMPAEVDPFDTYLEAPIPVADGLSSPRGPGTRINAIGHGRVTAVTDTMVIVEHLIYENNERRVIQALHEGLAKVSVAPGDLVERGQAIGALAKPEKARELHLKIGAEVDVAAYIRARGRLFVPHKEPTLVLVDTTRHRMRIVTNGQRDGLDLQVGFGQAAGCKERHKDLKTPCGMYFVTGKSTGPFSGEYADYYGGHFIKLNYPSAYDAQRGVSAGIMSSAMARAVSSAWRKRALTSQGTRLGGGIGFHGWAEEWEDSDSARGSWGCVLLHNRDIAAAYERIPVGAMVVLL